MKILFVCLGNICRSPMAEYILRHKLVQAGLQDWVTVDSAGTAGYHDGEDMHRGTAQMLLQHGIDKCGFIIRKVRKNDLNTFDYLIAMDNSNLADLRNMFGQTEKIFNITDLVPDLGIDHIPDPWYSNNFDQTYQLLDRCCDQLLDKIKRHYA
ncbi:low molecular weight protein-tyrosine-phosphatase [Pasteurella testudinis]|uniref:low molecular weight protein-tyrosine-phosphatase n=1 Tax=Pasteurella testudinis TaxID=761 RepID=UPI00405842C7